MIAHAKRHAAVALLAAVGVLGVPASALAGSGGTGLGTTSASPATGSTTTTGSTTAAPTTTGTTTGTSTGTTTDTTGTAPNPLVGSPFTKVSASGSGVTVSSTVAALLNHGLTFSGTAPGSDSGDTVEIERSGHQTNWRWVPTTSGTVGSGGSFTATWATDHIGQFAIRAIVESTNAQAAAASPSMSVIVYLPSRVSFYGPGFFGKKLACGGTLTATTFGVANRTLKCGTKVALMYKGKTIAVPVIDRGPYANGAVYDLTQATAQAIGMSGVVEVGAASLPTKPTN